MLETLTSIPNGELRSYGWVAREAGRPGAVRAVGNVCAHNPVPLVVPCHRVVPAAGGLGDYGYGPEMKRRLLEREGVDLERVERLEHAKAKYVKAGDRVVLLPDLPSRASYRRASSSRCATSARPRQLGLIPCGTCRPLVSRRLETDRYRRTSRSAGLPAVRPSSAGRTAVIGAVARRARLRRAALSRGVASCHRADRRLLSAPAARRAWLFGLGDVSGHGLEASVYMMMIQEEIERLADRDDLLAAGAGRRAPRDAAARAAGQPLRVAGPRRGGHRRAHGSGQRGAPPAAPAPRRRRDLRAAAQRSHPRSAAAVALVLAHHPRCDRTTRCSWSRTACSRRVARTARSSAPSGSWSALARDGSLVASSTPVGDQLDEVSPDFAGEW